jgi:branched-chain amino acid transport system permease protein
LQLVWQTIANGLILSAFYALMAVGLCLVYGIMKTANFAHGEFFMLGAYTVWLLYALNNWPFWVTVIVAIIGVGLLGVLAERVIFRPVRGDMLAGFIISLGLVFILQVFVGRIWGVGYPKSIPVPLQGGFTIYGVSVGWQRLTILPAALVLLGGLYFFLTRTKLGRAIRACAIDSEAAALHGVSADTMAAIALGIGSGLAGAAGALMAPNLLVQPFMGYNVIWMCFVVIIVGGMGNLKGALLASVLFGFLNTIITTVLDSTIAIIIANLVMATFLAFRPQGLVGYAEE